MEYEWDENKNAANAAKHGADFSQITEFDWGTALIIPDIRHSNDEDRFMAIGLMGGRLYVCIYVPRGLNRRIISLRKANNRERKFYEQKAQTSSH